MKSTAQLRGTDFSRVFALAKENETLLATILPEKLEWMHGVADGSRIRYDDILIYNTADRLMTGFVGECTTFIAQGNVLASGGGSLIAKNRDLGPNEIYKAAYIDIPQAPRTYSFVGSRFSRPLGIWHGNQ